MINLNEYINKTLEIKLGDDLLHVKMPSVATMGQIAVLEKGIGEDISKDYEIKQKSVYLMLNDNIEGKEIPMSIIEQIPFNGVMNLFVTISTMRVELETDPNSKSQSLREK